MSDAAAAADPSLPPPVVVGDHACLHCGYPLSGLPIAGVCPECANPVERSLRGDLLKYASPRYLAILKRSASLLAAAVGLFVVLFIITLLGLPLASYFASKGPGWSPVWEYLIMAGFAGVLMLMFLGFWMLAAADPSRREFDRTALARRIVRTGLAALALTSLACIVLRAAAPSIAPSLIVPAEWLIRLAGLATLLAALSIVRAMAKRIPDPSVESGARRTFVLACIVFGLDAAIELAEELAGRVALPAPIGTVLYWARPAVMLTSSGLVLMGASLVWELRNALRRVDPAPGAPLNFRPIPPVP